MRKSELPSRDVKKRGWGKIFLSLLVVLGIFFWWKMKQSVWTEDLTYMMVVVADEGIRVIGVNDQEERAVELIIPGNVMVPVVGMSGSLKASSLWEFAVDEGRTQEIVRASLELFLGTKLNGVMRVKSGLSWTDVFENRGGGELYDRIRWYQSYTRLRSDQIESRGIPESLTQRKRYPDGEEVIEVDEAILRQVRDYWSNRVILDERLGVEIFNTSGEEGLGRLLESLVLSSGGLVLAVEGGEPRDGNCFFAIEKDAGSKTVEWIEKWLGCRRIEESSGVGVRIWIGKEWAERYRRS